MSKLIVQNHPAPTSSDCLAACNLITNTPQDRLPSILNVLRQGGFNVIINPIRSANEYNIPLDQSGPIIDQKVQAFIEYVTSRAQWNLLSFEMLHEMYIKRMNRNKEPKTLGKIKFIREIEKILPHGNITDKSLEKGMWYIPHKNSPSYPPIRKTRERTGCEEPLFKEFGMKQPTFDEQDDFYRGIFRCI